MAPHERDTRKSEPIGTDSPWVTQSGQTYGDAFSHGPGEHGNEPPSPDSGRGLLDRIWRRLRLGQHK